MQPKTRNWMESAANISIVIIAILFCVTTIPRFFASKNNNPKTIVESGTKMEIPNYNWQASNRSLLMVLSSKCKFCSESAGFYRRIITETKGGDVRLVGVFPQDIKEARKYLQEIGVSLDNIIQVPLFSIGVIGTPTLILADEKGVAIKVWKGRLSNENEADLLKNITN